jgi:hypothetical protein
MGSRAGQDSVNNTKILSRVEGVRDLQTRFGSDYWIY